MLSSRVLTRASIAHPRRALLIAALITATAAPGLLRLELRTDGRALVPAAAPEIAVDRAVREVFDLRDPIAIVLTSDEAQGIFNPDTLRRVAAFSESLAELEGVRAYDISSLATELGFRHRSGTLRFRRLLEPMPETAVALDELRSDLERIEIYDGILVSEDGQSAAVFVGTPPRSDRAELVREIRRLSAESAEGLAGAESVAVLGAPVAEALLGHHILGDLGIPQRLLGSEDPSGGGSFHPGMVPIAIAVMALVFLIAFRKPAAALLPLLEIGICLVVVFGWMGWLGVPIYLTTSVLPVILVAVGVADEIHLFRRYLDLDPRGSRTDAEHRALVNRTLDEMAPPVIATSITTAIAFLAFAVSPLVAVREFGVWTALGVLVCMAFSLTVLPALLVVLGPRRLVRETVVRRKRDSATERSADPGMDFFGRLALFSTSRRVGVLVVAAVVVVVIADGVRRVEVQDSWIDGFAEGSDFAQATRHFDRHFLGSHLLQVMVEAEPTVLGGTIPEQALGRFDALVPIGDHSQSDHPERLEGCWLRLAGNRGLAGKRGDEPREWTTWVESAVLEDGQLALAMPRTGGSARFWLRPEEGDEIGFQLTCEPFGIPATLGRVDDFEAFLGQLPGVGGVLGPAHYLKTVGFMLRPDAADSRSLPENPREARNRWRNYGVIRGTERLGQLVDEGLNRGLVTAYLEDANYRDTAAILEAVRGYQQEHLEPHGLRLSFAGDIAVSQATIEGVVGTQLRSLLLSLVGIFLVASALGRSLRHGFYCLLPPAFAVAVIFAVMGWLGTPLGVATSMFASMTLGVGVDFAIHLLARYRQIAGSGAGNGGPIVGALRSTGPAILTNALAVGLGFGVLILSQVPANGRLGGLLMMSVLGCLVATIFLLPAMLGERRDSGKGTVSGVW